MKRLAALAILAAAMVANANANTRILTTELEVNAPIERAWEAWTTTEGIKTFFAPGGRIEPQVDGLYEIFFCSGRQTWLTRRRGNAHTQL